jgi:hypothetical protein
MFDFFTLPSYSKMTYTIQLLEPRAQKLLEELAQLNLIKFIHNMDNPPVKRVKRKPADLAGFAESIQEMNAHAKGAIQLPNMDDVLKEMAENKPI